MRSNEQSAIATHLLRYVLSYLVGTLLAASMTSTLGGSAIFLIFYSLVAGFPFFLVVLVAGVAFRRSVAAHPVISVAAVSIGTAMVWFLLGLAAKGLFHPDRLSLYAAFCAATCGAAFLVTTRFCPLRLSQSSAAR